MGGRLRVQALRSSRSRDAHSRHAGAAGHPRRIPYSLEPGLLHDRRAVGGAHGWPWGEGGGGAGGGARGWPWRGGGGGAWREGSGGEWRGAHGWPWRVLTG